MNGRSGIVTLTTDFGEGIYVASMKGVILGAMPRVMVVDVDHAIAPQQIAQAAFTIAHASLTYPPGTVHCAVVDPGVGTARRIVLVEAGCQLYLAPDNGLLTLVLDAAEGGGLAVRAWSVTNAEFFRRPVSPTFHGRDIFAPVAAAIAAGESIAAFGPPVDVTSLVRLPFPKPRIGRNSVEGSVVFVDRFGNLVTNIAADAISRLGGKPAAAHATEVFFQGMPIRGTKETYGEAAPGELVALIGSFGYLELAVVGGSAAEEYGARGGTPVSVRGSVTRP